ncbi:hypothetical protein BJ912DRAFT_1043427 [Pholiota molesta]|nr:hypothetical protein BJ912DRAFT_1043427 [Pholiota molesta]
MHRPLSTVLPKHRRGHPTPSAFRSLCHFYALTRPLYAWRSTTSDRLSSIMRSFANGKPRGSAGTVFTTRKSWNWRSGSVAVATADFRFASPSSFKPSPASSRARFGNCGVYAPHCSTPSTVVVSYAGKDRALNATLQATWLILCNLWRKERWACWAFGCHLGRGEVRNGDMRDRCRRGPHRFLVLAAPQFAFSGCVDQFRVSGHFVDVMGFVGEERVMNAPDDDSGRHPGHPGAFDGDTQERSALSYDVRNHLRIEMHVDDASPSSLRHSVSGDSCVVVNGRRLSLRFPASCSTFLARPGRAGMSAFSPGSMHRIRRPSSNVVEPRKFRVTRRLFELEILLSAMVRRQWAAFLSGWPGSDVGFGGATFCSARSVVVDPIMDRVFVIAALGSVKDPFSAELCILPLRITRESIVVRALAVYRVYTVSDAGAGDLTVTLWVRSGYWSPEVTS